MRVLIAGANGQIGRQLITLMGSSPHQAVAMIRDARQADRHEAAGAEIRLADLEDDVTGAPKGCDAVVFTAGSGGHTGGDKTMLVDLWGAIKLIDAAVVSGAQRFVMVSSIGAADPEAARTGLRHYMVAKKLADDHLAASGLRFTIVRPGRLNDEPATGRVTAGLGIGYGEIPRADVAACVLATLDAPSTAGKTFDLIAGQTDITAALAGL